MAYRSEAMELTSEDKEILKALIKAHNKNEETIEGFAETHGLCPIDVDSLFSYITHELGEF